MSSFVDRVNICTIGREFAATVTAEILKKNNKSEIEIRDKLQQRIADNSQFLETGWYSPPPSGIAVLFAQKDDVKRLNFDSLRNEKNWPNSQNYLDSETIGMVYLSPVDKSSGIICDFGFTFYRGENKEIQNHLKICLDAIEEAADYAEVGMKINDLQKNTQNIFDKNELSSGIVAQHDKTGLNFGHTIPWTFEEYTKKELEAVKHGDMNILKDFISHRRLYVNGVEPFKIPETIAFTLESRLVSTKKANMPDVFFHVIVSFKEGKKQIVSCYNPVFEKLGMNYIRSRF